MKNNLKNKKTVKKSNRGITLIALVVTIIVLLILAGISITMLSGDNSILKRAGDAREDSIIARENEQIKLAVNSSRINELGGNANTRGISKYFKAQGDKVSVYQNEDEIEIEYLDTGHIYIVKANGEIVKQEGNDTEEKKVFYKIDGTTLYLSSTKKDNNYKETEDYYFNNFNDVKLPEWLGEITTNEEGKKVLPISQIKKVVIEDRIQPKSTNCWFFRCENLTNIENIGKLDTKYTTDMFAMFSDCKSLTSIDVSNFNTSNVTDMCEMFSECTSLTSIDVSNFDTSNVTDMCDMFYVCTSLTSIDVSNFDTSNVTDMFGMFCECTSLTSVDVSNFNTSNVTDMNAMFCDCTSLTSVDVSNFNTSNVTDMGGMFSNCTSLTSVDVSNFNTSNVTDMSFMFSYCESIKELDLSNFDTSNVTNMSSMFNDCYLLTKLNVTGFNTSNVTDMSYMFNSLSALKTIDISSFDTRKVTSFKRIFNASYSLEKIYVGDNWNTEKNTEESTEVFPESCNLPNFNKENNAYKDLKWAYVGEGGYLSKK